MRLIDADDLRKRDWSKFALQWIDAAPTVDAPQPLTRDGVLAAVKAIEDAGGKAVVEFQNYRDGRWYRSNPNDWLDNPDVPRWNLRVRAVPVETEDVPLTQLVGRTIKGCSVAVSRLHVDRHHAKWWSLHDLNFEDRSFPDGTLDLATGLVTVLKGEA